MSLTYTSLYYIGGRTDGVGPGCDGRIGNNLNDRFRVKLDVYLNIGSVGSSPGGHVVQRETQCTFGLLPAARLSLPLSL